MDSPCLNWTKHLTQDGYGRQKVAGKMYLAHRIAYCAANHVRIEDIAGMLVRHKCDNPRCVNPRHLELGTQQDNMRDREQRGRTARGASVSTSKLSEEDVRNIRALYTPRSKDYGATALASRYGVNRRSIYSIISGKAWTHL